MVVGNATESGKALLRTVLTVQLVRKYLSNTLVLRSVRRTCLAARWCRAQHQKAARPNADQHVCVGLTPKETAHARTSPVVRWVRQLASG